MTPIRFWLILGGQQVDGYYVVEDETVILTDHTGTPLLGGRYSRKIKPGEIEFGIAKALLRDKEWRRENTFDSPDLSARLREYNRRWDRSIA
jgi:hypothetical protein